MSQTSQAPAQQRISDLKVSGHLMTLQTGLFCVFHTPGQQPPTAAGLPGVRISQPPLKTPGAVEIVTFEGDGWLGAQNGAALVRVRRGPAQVMITIYQELNSPHEAPRLQVVQLSAQADAPAPAAAAGLSAPAVAPRAQGAASASQARSEPAAQKPEVGAHIQRRGDVAVRLGEWMGEPGSHAWIEGFGVAPAELIDASDIEYQAVLGKGWLSPWVDGGQYCGSRGMALPILGLCVRLKGDAAKKFICRVTATFTDGTKVGPVENGEPVESETLAPLEAFLLEILPRDGAGAGRGRRKGKTDKASAKAAAEDLAALLEEEVEALEELEEIAELEELEDAEPEEFDLLIEEDAAPEESVAPRKRRGGRKPLKTKAAEPAKAVAPVKASHGRGRKASVPEKAAPAARSASPRQSARAKQAPSKAARTPAPRGAGRGRKPGSRR